MVHWRAGTVQGYAARWLAEWCSQPERSQLAVALGGGPLLDWLLDAATAADSDNATRGGGGSRGSGTGQMGSGSWAAGGGSWLEPDPVEQQQAQRALTFLLHNGVFVKYVCAFRSISA